MMHAGHHAGAESAMMMHAGAGMMHGGAGASIALILLFVVVPAMVLVLYLLGVRRERTNGAWSAWRTASFIGGLLLIIAAVVPPVSDWAHHDLRGHMVQHLLLGMFAPLALALGAPGTLLLRRISPAAGRAIVRFLGTAPLRVLTHPITAALLDIGGMYVLYLTPLYALSQADPTIHVLLHVHFLVSGYLFTWSIAGPDPAPHRPGMPMRLAVVFLATAAHATLGKIMYGYGYPKGILADAAELQAAAQWMYYGGDLAEVLLIVAFFALWFRRRHPLPSIIEEATAGDQNALTCAKATR